MPYFSYTAIDTMGREVRSIMEADTESLVLSRLRDQALQVVDIKELRKGKSVTIGKQKIKAKSLVIF